MKKRKKDITKEELQTYLDNIKPLVEKVKQEIKAVDDLKNAKDKAKSDIEKLTSLTPEQKQKYIDEVDKVTEIAQIKPIVDKATELDKAIKRLDDKILEAENLPNRDKVFQSTIDKLNKAIKEAKSEKVKTDVSKDEIEKLIDKINSLIDKAKQDISLFPQRVNFEEYKPKAEALFYDDITIAEKLTDDIFVNVDLGLNMTNLVKKIKNNEDLSVAIAGLQFGGSGKINPDLRMGAFIEYANKKAHHAGIGLSLANDNIKSFVRYRLAILDKKTINHNIDLYLRYGKEFRLEKDFSIYFGGGVLGTYSTATKLSDKVLLKQRLGVKSDIALRFNYIIDTLKIYAEPRINFGYNNQVLVQIDMEEHTTTIPRNYFEYGGAIGFNKLYENGVVINNELRFNADLQHRYSMNFTTKVAYKW